jgi:ubiquinone/menaquinone biosynthesis C-methylase UbiE
MENTHRQLSETELRQLAGQLRCPNGNSGLKVGEMMNFTNGNMIARTIAGLKLSDGDNVLEIGPGNGLHVKDIINNSKNIIYTGIDISSTMVEEAQKLNAGSANVSFQITDSGTIPFKTKQFDKIFTTNTIYFWKDPQVYAGEIARVMKPGGILSIGFIPKSTMQHIPFAKYGFVLYDIEMVSDLMKAAGLEVVSAITEKEFVTNNSEQQIEREFVILTAKKAL